MTDRKQTFASNQDAQGMPGSNPGHAARACRATGGGKAPSSVSGQNKPDLVDQILDVLIAWAKGPK